MPNFSDFILSIKYNTAVETYDESSTKQGIILPTLSYLGWNTSSMSEVRPEYPVNGKKVDYCMTSGITDVFMEVKKIGEKLEKHSEQLLQYSFKKGVELSILTNGLDWWFYLPLKKSSWSDRRFLVIDIKSEEVNKSVETFKNILSKENIKNKTAIEYANNLFDENMRRQTVEIALPNVWQNLMNDFDSPFIKMFIQQTEEKSGVRPTISEVREFIYNSIAQKSKQEDISRYRYFDAKPSIAHVLEVCWLFYKFNIEYKQAVTLVAHKRGLYATTVIDQCTRRLGLKVDDFRYYLKNRKKLISFLKEKFSKHSEQIENYLGE